MTRTLTADKALALIGNLCLLQSDNITKANEIVAASYATPDPVNGPVVRVDRRLLEGLTSALSVIEDASDKTVNLG